MILYIARHGQPALEGTASGANFEFPAGDYCLSALGRLQAAFLGLFLRARGFGGCKIISSPYSRTMETASIIAGICGSEIRPEPRIQEKLFYPEPVCPGLTLEEMRRYFPGVAPDARLAYPWITQKGPEEIEQIRARTDLFLEEFLSDVPSGDVLLVAHGASTGTLNLELARRAEFTGDLGYGWNCAVSSFEVTPAGKVRALEMTCFDFMPLDCVTSNRRRYGEEA